MVDIILIAIIGVLIGSLAGVLFFLENDSALGFFAPILVCGIIGGCVGWIIVREESSKYVASYTAAKHTIESSLDADGLTGFERAELVNEATERNSELAKRKYTASRWYGFTEDERILDLEYIDLG